MARTPAASRLRRRRFRRLRAWKGKLPPHPQFLETAPEHRSLDAVWSQFRFGAPQTYPANPSPETLRAAAYANSAFPVEAIEQFGRQFVARWTGTDEFALDTYAALLCETGLCVVVGHSQGASYALRCAQLYPEFVRAVVAVEPPCATESQVSEKLRAPHLFVWGDFIDGQSEIWTRYRSASERYRARLRAAGYVAELLDLPAQGLVGNSHMLIMDRNRDAIGASVLSWLRQQL